MDLTLLFAFVKKFGLIASSVLQAIYVIGLAVVVTSLVTANLSGQFEAGDPNVLAGYFASQAVTLLLAILIGLLGVALMTVVVRRDSQPPTWFVNLSSVFAIGWLVLVPIGIPIGALMLRWRSRVKKSIPTV